MEERDKQLEQERLKSLEEEIVQKQEEDEQRQPITMRVTDISINAEVTIEYSEPLNELNITNFNASDLINIEYRSMIT